MEKKRRVFSRLLYIVGYESVTANVHFVSWCENYGSIAFVKTSRAVSRLVILMGGSLPMLFGVLCNPDINDVRCTMMQGSEQ